MVRTNRLFQLLQAFRTLPAPITADMLAEATGVTKRSIYRDVETLRASGAKIEGERGYGYRLIEDGTLPPQAFSRMEIEAIVLGLAEVKRIGDADLAQAAGAVLAKVAATLPSLGQQHIFHAVSHLHRDNAQDAPLLDRQATRDIREACWSEQVLTIRYTDKSHAMTTRDIWPLAVVYTNAALVVLAHCCMRGDFRMFRVDRISSVTPGDAYFRPKRATLLRQYLELLRDL